MILVIDGESGAATKLKSMIEFMDAPRVVTAGPTDWHSTIGDERLDAVFIGSDVDDDDVDAMLDELEHIDPNISIVMLDSVSSA
jgi:DNA-binding NtrC family response regulator